MNKSIKELKRRNEPQKIKSRNRIKQKVLWDFTRNLSTMISAHVPIVKALEILRKQSVNLFFKNVIANLAKQIKKGKSLNESLEQHPEVFDKTYCKLVKVGETTGRLAEILKKQSIFLEKQYMIRKKISSSLVYPSLILLFAFLVITFLLLFMIPTFADLFQDFGSDIPQSTKILLTISNNYLWFILILICIISFGSYGFKKLIQFVSASKNWHKRILELPLIGNYLHLSFMADFCRTLSILLASGIPIVDSLELVQSTLKNKFLINEIKTMKKLIKKGFSLSDSIKDSVVFSNELKQIIIVGESSSNLFESLSNSAIEYEKQIESNIDVFLHLLEPIIISFLGIIIGYIVINLYLPIFDLINGF